MQALAEQRPGSLTLDVSPRLLRSSWNGLFTFLDCSREPWDARAAPSAGPHSSNRLRPQIPLGLGREEERLTVFVSMTQTSLLISCKLSCCSRSFYNLFWLSSFTKYRLWVPVSQGHTVKHQHQEPEDSPDPCVVSLLWYLNPFLSTTSTSGC